MSDNRLFLIDGSALAYRSYYAFAQNPLKTKRGEHTSVVYGFATTILRILSKEQPSHLAVVLDSKEPTFRHKMYADYKANRPSMPEDMVEQLPRLDELLRVMDVATLRKPGYEADDLIATAAVKAERIGWEVVIVTGDKDLFQLVDEKTKVLNLKKVSDAGEWIDREAVRAKMGVYPEQIVDLMALTGDSTDNVPGVTGVGPKTALQLLEQFGSFDGVYANVDKVAREKLREMLITYKDQAYLSRQLVTLESQANYEMSLDRMQAPTLDTSALRHLFMELEFVSLAKSLGQATDAPSETKQNYNTIDTAAELEKLVEKIKAAKLFAFDTETTGVDSLTCGLVGISLAIADGDAYYIPLGHVDLGANNLDADTCKNLLNPVLADPAIKKIAQNFKFDYQVLTRHGYTISSFDYDTMLASYVIDPAGQHGLDALALKHFNYSMQPITALIGTGKKQKSFAEVPVDKATFYSAEDADFTFRLYHKLEPMVRETGAEKLLHEIELPLARVLASMEATGVKIDVPFLGKMSKEIAAELDKIVFDIYALAGQEFNINSTAQLSEVLFNKLGLKPMHKTTKKTGYSTDVNVLIELAKQHDLPKRMLDYRKLQKLKSTYVDALPKLVKPRTGRVHTSYNQAVATTGRLSSTDPNLQNIPIRTEEGSQIRKAFIPTDGHYKLLTADYSQIELRILAHFAKEQPLIESFRNGEDIHKRTASEVFGVDLAAVTPDMRRVAKTANFAVIYGVTAFGLSQQSDMTVTEAKEFIDIYFKRYPMIRAFIVETIAKARQQGYVTTLFGRRRYLPEIDSKNGALRQFAERTAVNTVIQGTAADMIKIAMIEIDRLMQGKMSKMILQVHDELVFDTHIPEMEEMKQLVRATMEGCVSLTVPITVDMGVGDNWLESK
jgi:DNA polymerase I